MKHPSTHTHTHKARLCETNTFTISISPVSSRVFTVSDIYCTALTKEPVEQYKMKGYDTVLTLPKWQLQQPFLMFKSLWKVKQKLIDQLKKYIHTVYIVLKYILVGKHYKKKFQTLLLLLSSTTCLQCTDSSMYAHQARRK